MSETINESGNALGCIFHNSFSAKGLCGVYVCVYEWLRELKSNNYINPSFMLSVIRHKGAQSQNGGSTQFCLKTKASGSNAKCVLHSKDRKCTLLTCKNDYFIRLANEYQ